MLPGAYTEGIFAGLPDKDKRHSSLIFEGIKYLLVRCPAKEPTSPVKPQKIKVTSWEQPDQHSSS